MSTAAQPRFARVAAVIGDPTRALMLSRLLDGRFYTASDLAAHAGVSAPTASQHLKLLVDEGLARVRSQGRHRYFMLADANVAHALEALLRVADGALPETRRWQAPSMRALRHARTCYGHLAGLLGVDVCRCFVERGWVLAGEGDGHDYPLTAEGTSKLNELGITTVGVAPGGRLLYGCVDWSERRDHFAGPLAVALLDNFMDKGWLRRAADTRALEVSAAGRTALARLLE